VLYPVASVIFDGVLNGPGSSFVEVLTSPVTHRTLVFTVSQAALSTAAAVLLGLPAAFLLTRIRFRGRGVVRAALLVPFVLPPIVVVVGFIRMFGPQGILDSIAMTIVGTRTSVLNLSSGLTGIVLAHVLYNIPLVALMVSASLDRLSAEIEETAEILGASTVQRLVRIVLPHIRTALVSSALLVFLFCFMSFPIVLALGQGEYMTIEVQMWKAFRTFDYRETSSLALMQLCVTLALAYAYHLSRRGMGQVTRTLSPRTRSISELSRSERVAATAYLSFILVVTSGPVLSVIHSSVYDPLVGEYTSRGFTNLLSPGLGGGLTPLLNSLLYSSLATILSVTIALVLATSHRGPQRAPHSVESLLTLLPLGVSSITLAYGLLRAIAVPLMLSYSPWPLIVIAQTVIGLPFTTRAIETAASSLDQDYLDQADILGASRLNRLFLVEIPLMAPGIVVGAAFAFAMAIGEMSATLFIAMPQNTTLAVAIYQYLGVRKFVEAGACALVIVVACFVAFILMDRLVSGRAGGVLGWSE
ncbi:MAG: iron ABC transporter permease, partial [Candidatus Thorarchaeota archaeon]